MVDNIKKLDHKLKKVLWACNKYWQSVDIAPNDKAICFSWVVEVYRDCFGESFHQSALIKLTKLGFLKQLETSRSGRRRYYRIVNPQNPSTIFKL